MKITVLGATGMVGSAVTLESLARGHRVSAVSRRGREDWPTGVVGITADASGVADTQTVRAVIAGSDLAVITIRARPNEGSDIAATTTRLLDSAAATHTRVLVVGGAGPLRTPGRPDLRLVDNPAFVPPQWRDVALGSVAQLRACEEHESADWTYLSPPALLEPGTRTGRYRRDSDTALVDVSGRSWISVEDFAVAVVDEAERPGTQRHVTVGY